MILGEVVKMMKALRFHGQKDIRLDEIDIPKCGKGQVKVNTAPVLASNVLPSSR